MVDLSFAGRQGQNHPVLEAIAQAQVGDPVTLVAEQDGWHMKDEKGRSLGRMSRKFVAPSGSKFVRGEITAILRRRKEDGGEAYHHMLKRDLWEVIIPELVFESL
jgi:ATP-dependent DNA helicase RecQ